MWSILYSKASQQRNETSSGRSFHASFKDNGFSQKNSKTRCCGYRNHPIELETKPQNNTDTAPSGSDIALHMEIDSEGLLIAKLYDRTDEFNFLMVDFPFIYSDISAAP